MDMQISITEWNEEYKKLANLFINEENNLINTLLKADKWLLKIYHLFINSQTKVEKKIKKLKNNLNYILMMLFLIIEKKI